MADQSQVLRSACISMCRLIMMSLSNSILRQSVHFSAFVSFSVKLDKFEIYIILCQYSYHTFLFFSFFFFWGGGGSKSIYYASSECIFHNKYKLLARRFHIVTYTYFIALCSTCTFKPIQKLHCLPQNHAYQTGRCSTAG